MSYPYPNDPHDPRDYRADHYDHHHCECHDERHNGHEDCHCRSCKKRGCDILTPLASGSLRTRGDWVCIALPRHIVGKRPLKLTTVAAEGVTAAAIDPSCNACSSEYGLALRVTIPLSLTLIDCNGYQHAVCSSIDVCVPVTECSCKRLPRNAQVHVKACVSLAEPVYIDDCGECTEALLNMRIDAYIVGKLPEREPCGVCPLPLPWYPQPPKQGARGEWHYDYYN